MKYLLWPIILLIFGCASLKEGETPLERKYGDDFWGGEISYSEAVWYLTEPEHQFSVKGRIIYIYHSHQENEEKELFAKINFNDCPSLEESLISLRHSVVTSVAYISGAQPAPNPEVLVLDGDWMKLRMSGNMTGYFILNGDSGSYYTVPWIKSAQYVFKLAYDCAEAKS